MCGIAGILSVKDKQLTSKIKDVTSVLVHRGPDEKGVYRNAEESIALGHQRLCIIDLSPAARQPLAYLDRYHIVHNGELYNYLELRQTLQQKGYVFRTQSDTEVIVAAYAAFGAQCLQQFDGMYAFAIWDEKEQVLFAARDRFGEKPFFFSYNETAFLFASEMKALWEAGVSRDVNNKMLYNFLTVGYTSNPYDRSETFYTHIQKLPPASFLTYNLLSDELIIERYWDLAIEVNESITENAAIEQFTQLMTDSVQKRLRSDVAVGTSLSGGLDSSGIVALCAQQPLTNYSHKCFTAVFPGFEKSEEAQASLVAKRYGLNSIWVPVQEQDFVSEIETVLKQQEEPVGSASVFAQYKLFERVKQEGVTVLLDGQGADETLAGYYQYYKWYWQELYRQKKLSKSGELAAARKLGIKEPFSVKNKTAALFPEFAAAILQGSKAKRAFRQRGLNSDFAFENKPHFYYSLPAQPTLNGALYFSTMVNGLEELLRYADRNSMAHGIEVRLPFLSHKQVEFLFTLPPYLKIRNGWTKWLLRKAMETKLPEAITWRKDKVGFEPPQKKWMQHPDVLRLINESKKILVDQNVLDKSVLQLPITASNAHDAQNSDWRYLSASFLFRH